MNQEYMTEDNTLFEEELGQRDVELAAALDRMRNETKASHDELVKKQTATDRRVEALRRGGLGRSE